MRLAWCLRCVIRCTFHNVADTTKFTIDPLMTASIRFFKGDELISLSNVPPSRTLLEVLREDLNCTAVKEGCNEGDCGACVVALGEAVDGQLNIKAINSCIRLAHSVDGMAVWTASDIAPTPTTLHPVQEALVQCHASQCGFCTPGFVMSLFAMYQNHTSKGHAISRELAQQELSGNLCRCTGYRPILDAAQMLHTLPTAHFDEADLLSKLELLAHESIRLEANLSSKMGYKSPISLKSLLKLKSKQPDAQIVAGTTDVGLWVTKQHRLFGHIIDVTQVRELRRIEDYPHHIAIGAAVTLNDAFSALVKDRPQLSSFVARFAGLSVRNSGTLGGNIAGGSPIGDSMPLLISLGANVVLMSQRGSREFAIEDFYTGYKTNLLAPDEVLAWIKVPKPLATTKAAEFSRIYKISKRFDDDISAVCLGLNLYVEDGVVTKLSIGVGGVAATPVRAIKTEAACAYKQWSKATIDHIKEVLREEFKPLSDMRASSAYRTQVLGNLLDRFWLESQGMQQINLESFNLSETV